MRWPPWKRRKKDTVGSDQPVNLDDIGRQARFAENAHRRASRDLRETRRRGEEVARVTGSLEVRLSRNHWAEMMEETFRRNPHG